MKSGKALNRSQNLDSATELLSPPPVYGSIEAAMASWGSLAEQSNPVNEKQSVSDWMKSLTVANQAASTDVHYSGQNAADVVHYIGCEDDQLRGQSTNRPPLTRQPLPATREAGGVDWIEYCLYGEFGPAAWKTLREQLLDSKRVAAASGEGRCLMRLMDRDTIVSVLPGGKGRGYSYCAFNLEVDGIALGICDKRESGGEPIAGRHAQPIVYVRATGLTCLVRGWQWVVERAGELLAIMGFETKASAVSRLDLCTDVTGIKVIEFQRAFLEGRCIRLSDEWAMWGRGGGDGLETLRFGSTDGLSCRIYDKLAETARDSTKREFMRLIRWGCDFGEPDPPSATRVEFQLRRDQLKGQGLYSLDDLTEGIGNVMKYLTSGWLRFTAIPVDRENRNQGRAGVMAKWAKVQKASERWAKEKEGFRRGRRPTLPVDDEHRSRMAVGCLGSILAGRDQLPATKEACFAALCAWGEDWWRLIGSKAAIRRLEMEVKQPDQGTKVCKAYVRDAVPVDRELLAGIFQRAE